MRSLFDELTEGNRERDLMRRVRAGEIPPAEIAREGLRFPVKIQIQTFSPCNAACAMCPWPETSNALPQGRMSEATYERIVDQLVGRGVERTSLFLMNEPTLDRRLEAFTALLKQKVPETTAIIFTNGRLLDGDRAEALARAGMDEVDISVVGFTKERYETVMKGLQFDATLASLEEVGARLREGRLGAMKVKVVGLEVDGIEEGLDEFRERTGLSVYLKPVTNRAGSVNPTDVGGAEVEATAPTACQRPFVKAYVIWNGDVVLCNCDWKRTTVLGNVNESSLEEIWNGEALQQIRRDHIRLAFPRGSLCSTCDYPFRL